MYVMEKKVSNLLNKLKVEVFQTISVIYKRPTLAGLI